MRLRQLSAFIAVLAVLLCGRVAEAQLTPQVNKIDPPEWWIGLPPDPMLLLTGANLQNVEVTTDYPGVRVEQSRTYDGGRHLFVWLKVDERAEPGTVRIAVKVAAGGETRADFPLRRRGAKPGGIGQQDAIYLIMPDRFADGDQRNNNPAVATGRYDRKSPRAYHGGDFKGIEQRLGYLKELGATAIWLTPWWENADNASDYHGYHVTDFYAVEEHLGSMSDLQDLCRAAHAQGIKVVLDFVANHIGPEHSWTTSPPTPTWLHGSPQRHRPPSHDFGRLVDPHAPAAEQRDVLEGWFPSSASVYGLPDLNPDDPLVARYLLQNALWWIESAGLDAVRLDTFPYSSRRFWSGWHKGLRAAYPGAFTVGEVFNEDPTITSFFAGDRTQYDGVDSGVSTVFDFPLFEAMRDVVVRRESTKRIVEVLQRDALYPHPERLMTLLGNHDTPRLRSEATVEAVKAGFALLLTLRGIPQIYAGDEIAMPGGGDPDNRRDFPGGFPGDRRDAFAEQGRTAEEQSVFRHVQDLLRLRREHPALSKGALSHIAVADDYYAYLRHAGTDRVLMVFNKSEKRQNIMVSLADTPGSDASRLTPAAGGKAIEIRGEQALVAVPGMYVAIYIVQ